MSTSLDRKKSRDSLAQRVNATADAAIEATLSEKPQSASSTEKPGAFRNDSTFIPDYVVKVENKSTEATAAVANQLINSGFYLKPIKDDSYVLFNVRICPERLAEVTASAQARDHKAGVLTPAVNLEGEDLTPAGRDRLCFEALQEAKLTPDTSKAITDVWPYGSEKQDVNLFKQSLFKFSLDIDRIRTHYGDEVALYFGFASYTAKNAVILAVLGLGAQFLIGPYSLFVTSLFIVWGVYFAFSWRHTERSLSRKWLTENLETTFTRRVDYHGTTPESRQLRALAFVPFAIFLCFLYVLGVFAGLVAEIFLNQIYDGPYDSILKLAPTGYYVVLGQVFRLVYNKSLDLSLSFEDYPTEEELQRHRIQRQFWATFFVNYTPILLSAYFYLPFGETFGFYFRSFSAQQSYIPNLAVKEKFVLNTERLAGQAQYFTVTNQFIILATDLILPLLNAKKAESTIHDPAHEHALLGSKLPVFNPDSDYLLIITLLGYALLVAPVWPLGAVAVAFGVFIRVKVSAAKLAFASHRPVPRRAKSIGPWNSDLLFLIGFASITGPTICVMFGTTDFDTQDATIPLIRVTPLAVAVVALLGENIFLLFSKSIEASFNILDSAPQQGALPEKQRIVYPRPTPADIQWANNNWRSELASLQ